MSDEKQLPAAKDQASLNGHEHKKPESVERTLVNIHRAVRNPLARIHKADPTQIQCVAAANLELNDKYHDIILRQATQSFFCAIITASLGFLLFSGAVVFFMQHLTQFALIATMGSALTAVISGTTFYLHRRTLTSFEHIHKCLARTELLLLGNSLCMQMQDKEKQTDVYMDLIKNVTQLTVLISEGEHERNQRN